MVKQQAMKLNRLPKTHFTNSKVESQRFKSDFLYRVIYYYKSYIVPRGRDGQINIDETVAIDPNHDKHELELLREYAHICNTVNISPWPQNKILFFHTLFNMFLRETKLEELARMIVPPEKWQIFKKNIDYSMVHLMHGTTHQSNIQTRIINTITHIICNYEQDENPPTDIHTET
jgi:hypothetical protein